MQRWNDNTVDLIYLDPPFNSKANYNMLFGDEGGGAQYRAFNDIWYWDAEAAKRYERYEGAMANPLNGVITGLFMAIGRCGMMAYLTYMAERLEEMYRLLKPTGSIYLHCDPTASHYLKVIMDGIFNPNNFRNEIVWRIGWVSGYKTQKRGWIRNHDTILYYLKTDAAKGRFNKEYIKYKPDYLRRDGNKPTGKGVPIEDTWNCSEKDILNSIMIMSFSKEKLSYPTQKPLALLDRILKASSNKEEIVLDPFCGCGTTIESAQKLGRQWVGIDISAFAIDLIKQKRLPKLHIPTKGIPADFASAKMMSRESPFDFESWAITRLYGFVPNTKKVADHGVDGRGKIAKKPQDYSSQLALAQVKGGKFNLGSLRDFQSVIDRDKGAVNYYITLDKVTSRTARAEAARMGQVNVAGKQYDRLNLWSIEEYFDNRYPNQPPMNDPYTGKHKSGEQASLAL